MKAVILTDKAIRELILSLRISGPNRSLEKERDYARKLIAKLQGGKSK